MDIEKVKEQLKADEMIIPTEELDLAREGVIPWSGQYLVKILSDEGDYIYSLGSGGLIKYKERYFAITNRHVVKQIEKSKRLEYVNIPYQDKFRNDRRATIISEAEDFENDLAAFEISPYSVFNMSNLSFLEEEFFEKDVPSYLKNYSNVVFTHGYPSLDTVIDYQNKAVDMTTLPYTTFIYEYDEFVDAITLYAKKVGEKEKVSTYFGMSGSLVYGYYRDKKVPYKCLGVLTTWEQVDERLIVVPLHDVTNFLDKEFFAGEK